MLLGKKKLGVFSQSLHAYDFAFRPIVVGHEWQLSDNVARQNTVCPK